MKQLILGISGVAACGKDTLAAILMNRLKTKHFISSRSMALANELKRDCEEFIKEKYGYDVWTTNRKEKEIFRPILVSHGKVQRVRTNGRYWVEKLNTNIKECMEDVIIVTDIRYKEYDIDEVDWLKDEHKGILIHVSKFVTDDGISIRFNHRNPRKIYTTPPNEDERKNDPIIRKLADYSIEWEDQTHYYKGNLLDNDYLNEIAEGIIQNLKERNLLN